MFKEYAMFHEGKILRPEVKAFIEKNHYKKSARSLKPQHVYSLYHEDLLIGVAIYGQPCGTAVEKKYGEGTLELRRFCLINEAPRNSESFFLGKTLRDLRKHAVQKVVSYADTNKKHEGIIYRASNWTYLGKEQYRQQVLKYGRKVVSMREVYQRGKDGEYRASALRYQALKAMGEARAVLTKAKHIFLYEVNR